MARTARVDLRVFQQELAERLAARTAARTEASRLAFCTGESCWLSRLEDTGEVLTVPGITPVPLTQSWYVGVANIRGSLYGIVDLSAFLGHSPARTSPQARVVLLGARAADLRAGLLVERVAGLRSPAAFEPAGRSDDAPAWSVAAWTDESGRVWHELDLGRLARDSAFLHIGR
jgi:twitching motility protein PilI